MEEAAVAFQDQGKVTHLCGIRLFFTGQTP